MGVNIGAREVVGYGMNGEITYVDNTMSPFPAIRFQEDKGEIVALRAKENGEWKKVLAGILSAISVAMCMMVWFEFYAFDKVPETMLSEEHQKAQIERMIALRVNPIEGLGSTYDYEK